MRFDEGRLHVWGWAADVTAGVPVDEVLLCSGSPLLYRGPLAIPRPEVATLYGCAGLERPGFSVWLPRISLTEEGLHSLAGIALLADGPARGLRRADR